jgi:hypothetical protein
MRLGRLALEKPEARGFDLIQRHAFKSEEMAEESGEVAPGDGGLLPVEGGEQDIDGTEEKEGAAGCGVGFTLDQR